MLQFIVTFLVLESSLGKLISPYHVALRCDILKIGNICHSDSPCTREEGSDVPSFDCACSCPWVVGVGGQVQIGLIVL